MRKELKVLETFAGIGAPRKALIRGGYNYKIVDSIEIDPNPIKSYNAIYEDNIEPQDISKWNKTKEDIGEIDLIWNSSPCQDFSIAGTNKSGEKDSGTRSSLVYEVIRITKEFMPKYIVWENVKGLTTKKHKYVLDDYILKLEELGYNSQWQVLNSKDYGIPQSRERVFVVSIRKDLNQNFTFPNRKDISKTIENFIEEKVDEKYYKICPSMIKAIENNKCKVLNKNDLSNTITTKQERWNNAGFIACELRYDEGIRLFKDNNMGTLRTIDACGNKAVINNSEIRYLTEKECWRLMGFDDEDYEKAAKAQNYRKSILYKQAGNSVVVNVIEAIFDNLLIDYQ